MYKKILSCLLAVFMLASLTACGGTNTETPAETDAPAAEPLQVVCTIFPAYDWTRQIMGAATEQTELTMLLDSGVDLHSFQPTADDMIQISDSDLFIYVGGESDQWVSDALQEAANEDMVVLNLMEVLGDTVKEEEIVEGMQAEDEHDHAADGQTPAPAGEEEAEYDEHIWLSVKNAIVVCGAIRDALCAVDGANAATYTANAEAYIAQLRTLDDAYQAAVDGAACKTVVFGDRFPFRYLADDYGIDYYAAFVGCSAETEASFDTVVFLAGKVDELGLSSVLTIESGEKSIAETVVSNTQTRAQRILTMDSMQSVTAEDAAGGETYLGIMQANLDVLRQALN